MPSRGAWGVTFGGIFCCGGEGKGVQFSQSVSSLSHAVFRPKANFRPLTKGKLLLRRA